jgi:hypothetical protein
MIRVHVICEGQTEEMFVNEILVETFLAKDVYLIPALIGKPGHKGGNFKFDRLLTDVQTRLLGDKTAYCTTFFDFYGLPEDFPGKKQAKTKNGAAAKAHCLLKELTEKLKEEVGENPLTRFIPYVQMYEFEGLLFSDPVKLAQGIDQPNIQGQLQQVRNSFASPEEINDSPITAPSKRIINLYSGYEKPIHGSLAAIEIGLNVIRQECAQFNDWLNRIESLH